MTQNSIKGCSHHPIKYYSAPAKVFFFIFRREYAINSFRCQSCNIMLSTPLIYYNVVLRLCYFLFSAASTTLLVHHVRSGGVLSQVPAIISLSFLCVAIYIFYRLVSSLLLAFGKWEPDLTEGCASTRRQDLLSYNSRIGSIMTTGMLWAQMMFRNQQLPLFIFIEAIIVTILGLTKKKNMQVVVGMALLMYSVFPLFFLNELSAQLQYINNVFATLLTVILVVSK